MLSRPSLSLKILSTNLRVFSAKKTFRGECPSQDQSRQLSAISTQIPSPSTKRVKQKSSFTSFAFFTLQKPFDNCYNNWIILRVASFPHSINSLTEYVNIIRVFSNCFFQTYLKCVEQGCRFLKCFYKKGSFISGGLRQRKKNGKLNRKLARSHSSSLETTDQVKQMEQKLSDNQINKIMLIFWRFECTF